MMKTTESITIRVSPEFLKCFEDKAALYGMTVEQLGFWLLGKALIDKQEGLHYLRNFDGVKPLKRKIPRAVRVSPDTRTLTAEERAELFQRGWPDVQAAR